MAAGSIAGLAGVLIWTEADRFPAMARFYRDTLGLTPRSAKEDFINFDWSGVRLSVGVHDRVRGASRESLRIMLNLTVADIRAVHERLARAGVACSRERAREDGGGWVATFADSAGYILPLLPVPPCREGLAVLRVIRLRRRIESPRPDEVRGVPLVVEAGDGDTSPRLSGMDEAAVADVDPVVAQAIEED